MKKFFKRLFMLGLLFVLMAFMILFIMYFKDPLFRAEKRSFLGYIDMLRYCYFCDPTGESAAFVGLMYHDGGRSGNPRREELAEYWTLKAANKGYGPAMVNMGRICISKDKVDEGILWFVKAAKNGCECEEYKELMKPVTMEEINELQKETEELKRKAETLSREMKLE